MRYREHDNQRSASESVIDAFESASGSPKRDETQGFELAGLPESAGKVMEAIGDMSRRIEDLARNLNCLGYFYDDDDDRPRAA